VSAKRPLACVIGGTDLVRPLGLAAVKSAVVVTRGDVAVHSRFTRAAIPLADPTREPDLLLARLMAFAETQPEPPVLFYGQDADVLFVSRQRDRLRQRFRFVVPDGALVEDLVDKARFDDLVRRLDLPVPPSSVLATSTDAPDDVGLRFPLVVKPRTHEWGNWSAVAGEAKALRVDTLDELRGLWPRLAGENLEVVVQELVPGPETRVESYHVYVDAAGEVAKLDFKRDADGRLHLLEVNPRFNLWHHPGARAGVNLPALVYNDLVGLPRPLPQPARPGVRWIYDELDARAAHRDGVPMHRWIPWAVSCETKSIVALDDPVPMVVGALRRIGGAVGLRPRGRPRITP
jgi:D-aspartate ligase